MNEYLPQRHRVRRVFFLIVLRLALRAPPRWATRKPQDPIFSFQEVLGRSQSPVIFARLIPDFNKLVWREQFRSFIRTDIPYWNLLSLRWSFVFINNDGDLKPIVPLEKCWHTNCHRQLSELFQFYSHNASTKEARKGQTIRKGGTQSHWPKSRSLGIR